MKKHFILFVLIVLTQLTFAQPVHDFCDSAENITVSTSNTAINTDMMNVTVNYEVGCNGTFDNYGDIWYEFIMPLDANIFINSPNYSLNYGLYDSCSEDQIQCGNASTLFTNLVSGTTYKLRVFTSENFNFFTNINFGIRILERPANDDCAFAQPITASNIESEVNFIMGGASLNNEEGCTGTIWDFLDIWYEFTMPVDGMFIMSEADAVDIYALYDDCSGVEIQCGTSTLFTNLVAGTTYKLRLINNLSTTNQISSIRSFTYRIPNDNCDNSINIPVSTSILTVEYDIDIATLEISSQCNGTGIGYYADIWYDFTMPVNGNLIIDTAFNNENYYEIYDTCGTTRLDCGYDSFVFYGLSAGTNYKLRVYRAENELFEDFWDQTFDISAAEISSNNDCANSENITVSSTPLEIFTSFGGSTFNSNNECAAGTNIVDLWYDFTMPIDGIIQINKLLPSNGSFYALYDTCDGTLIGCFQSQGNFTDLTMGTNYKLRFFDNNQFNWDVDFTIQTTDALSIDDQTLEKTIQIFPNPTDDHINIILADNHSLIAIDCYDIFGKKVLKTNQTEQIDVSKLKSGMYFIIIETDKGQFTKKVIIQ